LIQVLPLGSVVPEYDGKNSAIRFSGPEMPLPTKLKWLNLNITVMFIVKPILGWCSSRWIVYHV